MTDALITTTWFIGLVLIVVSTLRLGLRVALVAGSLLGEVFADQRDAPVRQTASGGIAARNEVSLSARRSRTAIDIVKERRAAA